MRLICPNCAAEYEVPDDVVPKAGRDVQCSACGQTWFATPEGVSPPEPIEGPPPVLEDDDRLVEDPDAPDPDADDEDDNLDAPVPDPGQPAKRRQLDPSVADVLRQERDTSQALKRGELSEYDVPETEPGPSRDATAKTVAAAAAASAAAATGSAISRARSGTRRVDAASQLPDVEEINSTLRPDGRRAERGQAPERAGRQGRDRGADGKRSTAKPQRRGFRLGFLLVLIVALIAWLIYWQAPRLAETFPGAALTLGNYVIAVDNARTWLSDTVASLTGGA